jgi:hypothetical protein
VPPPTGDLDGADLVLAASRPVSNGAGCQADIPQETADVPDRDRILELHPDERPFAEIHAELETLEEDDIDDPGQDDQSGQSQGHVLMLRNGTLGVS